jgi:hypothetical protein
MSALKPQPRTRQRALLKEWCFDERYVPEDGIGDNGIKVLLGVRPPDWNDLTIMDARVGDMTYSVVAYPTCEHHDRMMQARADDWEEYKNSLRAG